MDASTIIYLILTGVVAVGGLVALIYAIVRGEIKEFVIKKMQEAEELYKDLPKPEKGKAKLQYVIEKVNEHYGIVKIFLNVKKFIEKIIEITKK